MGPKWLIFFMYCWILGSVLGTTLEGAFVGTDEGTILNTLITCKALTSTTVWGRITGLFTDPAMWVALFKAFAWDFSFWVGAWILVWWFFLAIVVGILYSVVTAWIRGVGGA